jgi:antitoxin component YwqK of YwqJK toxin-antitoxin module
MVACVGIGQMATGETSSQPKTTKKNLDKAQVIQKYSCAKGDAWFYEGGKLNRCTLAQDTKISSATVPAGSLIDLLPDGTLSYAMMLRPVTINGALCDGGGLLGPSEGAMTSFYPSGKLKACFLKNDQTVGGVPCAKGGIIKATLGHQYAVEFYETGKLKSCGLAIDYGGKKKGEQIQLAK